jgi:hypothetical protein
MSAELPNAPVIRGFSVTRLTPYASAGDTIPTLALGEPQSMKISARVK